MYVKLSIILFLLVSCGSPATEVVESDNAHPRLAWTAAGVQTIRAGLGEAPLFDQTLEQTKTWVDAEIAQPIEVPIPKDMAGGYTHERHKQNWFSMHAAGILFQLTEDAAYAIYIRDMLLEYARIYPELPLHPTERSYATGKIFWQCLNDANWLVYVSQAYDNIYEWLSTEEREILETQLFRPYADFLSLENPQFFNRIHNHSTWGNAAVGMIGLAMKDTVLIERALYGLDPDLIADGLRDDDTGLIKAVDGGAGFLAQLDGSFSPDGYFTEGPYYLRYAIYPFLVFGQALANNWPELDILGYRDSILKKASWSLLYQADPQGQFFPINDAQKGMSWDARELITAVDMAYFYYGEDPSLLSVIEAQARVVLDEAGFAAARAIAAGEATSFAPKSMAFVDGPEGDEGGLAVLRAIKDEGGSVCLVTKYTPQGMGHGHFDKLSYSYYDEDGEIIQDYGSARWVNIDQKGGGRYLPENNSWAKQSIAHNTLVINESSHYQGNIRIGELHHPDLWYFNVDDPSIQVVSMLDTNAYPGYELKRTMLLVKLEGFPNPLLVDVFQARGQQAAQFDLPTWFQGHLLEADFPYSVSESGLPVFGQGHGYQHLLQEARGIAPANKVQISWLNHGKFFTQTALTDVGDELHFLRLGANDPAFNLRRDPAFLIRKQGEAEALFVSVLETHGSYNPADEIPHAPYGQIQELDLLEQSAAYTVFSLGTMEGKNWTITLSNEDARAVSRHSVRAGSTTYEWEGPFAIHHQN
ncbi:MAG: heparinase II/III family protein [Bacteroidota bacterium]